jgi:HEAT repeat protein
VSKRTRISLFVGLLFIIAALILAVARSREPVYNGKKLSEWLQILTPDPEKASNPKDREEAEFAIRQIGTNALPVLLKMLHSKENSFKSRLKDTLEYDQEIVDIRFLPRDWNYVRAVNALFVLGPSAKPTIPELNRMLADVEMGRYSAYALSSVARNEPKYLIHAAEHENEDVRSMFLYGLSEMGTNSEPLLPLIIPRLTDKSSRVRSRAASTLGHVATNQPSLAVPLLIKALNETNETAMETLGKFGRDAIAAVPILRTFLHDQRGAIFAGGALTQILGEDSISLLSEALTNEINPDIQWRLIGCFELLGEKGKGAVPLIKKYVQAKDPMVHSTAIRVIKRIDPTNNATNAQKNSLHEKSQ